MGAGLQQWRAFSIHAARRFPSPGELYDKYVSQGEIESDEHQREIVRHLDTMHRRIVAYSPPSLAKPSFVRQPAHLHFRRPTHAY